MNPFDLRGPQFLVFYVLLSIGVLIAVHVLRKGLEARWAAGPTPVLRDPYAIAYLRGGRVELLRVAVLSLVDRGLLHVEKDQLATTQVGQHTQTRKRLEDDLLRFCIVVRNREELFATKALDAGVSEYQYVLAQHKLVADDEIDRMRTGLMWGAASILLGVSIAKIAVAIGRGRGNVGFLILLTVLAVVLARKIAFPRTTILGRRFLDDLQNLFQSLKLRAPQIRPGGANADLVLAAAVFGLDMLPQKEFAWAWDLHPPQQGSSSGCGSSCGSGCGGGGCGGGCGGCGG